MAAPTATRGITLEEYLRMPMTMQRQEIVNGELIVMPGTMPIHQRIAGKLLRQIGPFLDTAALGEAFIAPVDVLIREVPFTYRQPDLFVVSAAELAQHPGYETEIPMRARPFVAFEILSPSHYPKQLTDRLEDYASIGVDEVWVLTLGDRMLRILSLGAGGYQETARFEPDEPVGSSLLPGFSFTVAELAARGW